MKKVSHRARAVEKLAEFGKEIAGRGRTMRILTGIG
jgi:hypothetical protein